MNRAASLLLATLFSFEPYVSTPNPYPNEIGNLKFYVRYLAPLQPDQSDATDVIHAFGSKQELQLEGWRVTVLYSCNDDPIVCSHGPGNDRLHQIVVTPEHRVTLSHRKFPTAFSHSVGTVSEINVFCDVYKDSAGLEYWVVARDSVSYKKGDLLWISYGAPHPIIPQMTGHSVPLPRN